MKPLCIDLFCGLGGWAEGFVAEGYRVVGFDIDPRFAEPYRKAGGEFVLADVRTLDGRRFRGARCIMASPPCGFLSTQSGVHRDVSRGMILIREAFRVCREAGVPFLIENVHGAVAAVSREFGAPRMRHRPWYAWGDFPGFIAPVMSKGRTSIGWKKKYPPGWWGWRRRAEAARIPLPLARAVARGFL